MSNILKLIYTLLLFSIVPVFGQLDINLMFDAADLGNNCHLITPNQEDSKGALWYKNPIDFTNDFEFIFDGYFGVNDDSGADGLALVFKTSPKLEFGAGGRGIGYAGIANSFAIEFDTYQNLDKNDPVADHIGLMLNGNASHALGLPIAEFTNLEDGRAYEFKFTWNAASQKIVLTKDCVEIISYTGDIVNIALNGNSTAYFGLTGTTGGAANEHKVCYKYISFASSLQNQELCNGASLNSVDATFLGATKYNWTPIIGVNDPKIPKPTFSPTITTTYQVEITGSCGNLYTESFTITVKSTPTATTPTDMKSCIAINGIASFNLTDKDNEIINGLKDVSISYHSSQSDADINISPITSPFESGNTKIYARVENNKNTQCLDFATTNFSLNVYETPLPLDPSSITPISKCDDISTGSTSDGLAIFDLTQRETEMLNGQSYTYFIWTYFTDSSYTLSSQILSPESFTNSIVGGQTIYVRMINNLESTCFSNTYFEIEVFKLPNFAVESSRVICESGTNSTITLDVIQDNMNEVLDYEWTDENGGFISNAESIDVTSSGIYTVTLSKTNGTGCLRSKTINVLYSERANIDYDDITIIDDSNNNSISINNDNQNLGKGDYEFSLDVYGPYQDEPVFENLIPGVYTVYVKDKNQCRISELEVSILGFPKFFSPNNDGKNDNWQVLGINKNFYASSTIYIYNRFGKIIAKVNPLNAGWNGYYNGAMSPSDDYWYSTVLTDRNGNLRMRKGHFSLLRK
jgi:gliding motility-associated-like protein